MMPRRMWTKTGTRAFAAVSKRIEASVITPPMCFVAFGMLMGSNGLGVLGLDPEEPLAHVLAEVTLVLVLFTDAARIDLRVLRRDLFGIEEVHRTVDAKRRRPPHLDEEVGGLLDDHLAQHLVEFHGSSGRDTRMKFK